MTFFTTLTARISQRIADGLVRFLSNHGHDFAPSKEVEDRLSNLDCEVDELSSDRVRESDLESAVEACLENVCWEEQLEDIDLEAIIATDEIIREVVSEITSRLRG